jgi:beta-lactamase superfamily II metal-dependent hydrolase
VLDANGITSIDYFVAGTYDAAHIGAIDELLNSGIPINIASYDRGGASSLAAFSEYIDAVGSHRVTIALNQQIDLGGGCILTCLAVDGQTNHGTVVPVEENDRAVALVRR